MRHPYSSHGSTRVSLMLLGSCALCCVVYSMTGCAQRVRINSTHGNSYKSVFYQQASTPAVQLAPTTSEDAKRISKSRARRSDGRASGRRRGFAGSSSSTVGN
jgi:hypothetical protein